MAGYSFEEITQGVILVSKAQALAELRKHGANLTDFFQDLGDHPMYEGQSVLEWLGY